jgi:hypothetical protein
MRYGSRVLVDCLESTEYRSAGRVVGIETVYGLSLVEVPEMDVIGTGRDAGRGWKRASCVFMFVSEDDGETVVQGRDGAAYRVPSFLVRPAPALSLAARAGTGEADAL